MDIFKLYIEDIEPSTEFANCISGIIYFKFNDLFFPDNMWFDAVSSILQMWANSLCCFFRTDDFQCELPFMDGDYKVRVTKNDSETIIVSCIANTVMIAQYNVSVISLIQNIQEAITVILHYCKNTKSIFKRRKVYYRLLSAYRNLTKLKI